MRFGENIRPIPNGKDANGNTWTDCWIDLGASPAEKWLFDLTRAELAEIGLTRFIVDTNTGGEVPC